MSVQAQRAEQTHAPGRRAGHRTAAVLLAVLVCALAATVPAVAQYTRPRNVSPPHWDATFPSVAVDRQGDALAVWTRKSPDYPYTLRVQGRIRSRSGALGNLLLLSPMRHAPGRPLVDTDDDGDSVVVWQVSVEKPDGGIATSIYARRLSRTGTVGELTRISGDSETAYFPELAVDHAGNAVISWNQHHPDTDLAMIRRLSADGSLGPIQPVAPTTYQPDTPLVAFDADGDGVVVWKEPYEIHMRTMTSTGELGPKQTVFETTPTSGTPDVVRVLVAADGSGYVTWGTRDPEVLRARRFGASGELGDVYRLSPRRHATALWCVDTDAEGDAVIAWTKQNVSSREPLFARTLSHTGILGSLTRIDNHATAYDVDLADDGHGIVLWRGGDHSPDGALFSSTVTKTGVVRPPQLVSHYVSGVWNDPWPTADVSNATGAAVAVWLHNGTYLQGDRVQLAAGP